MLFCVGILTFFSNLERALDLLGRFEQNTLTTVNRNLLGRLFNTLQASLWQTLSCVYVDVLFIMIS
jgi:hypothetical protein